MMMHSLTSLPGEILAAIVANLGPSANDYHNFSHDYQPDVTLYRLAQTCKILRDICLPKLYEICNVKVNDQFPRGRDILRTFAKRPDIAGFVKRIIISGSLVVYDYDEEVILSAEDAELFNGILEKSLDMSTIAPLNEILASEDDEDNCEEGMSSGEALACVALSLVPNVKSIVFSSFSTSLGHFKPGSFPLLEAFSLQHADTECGAYFESAKGVLTAAPNVSRFIGWAITEIPEIPYTSITEVVLAYSGLDSEQAARLPKAFPNLERFTYDYGGACVSDRASASPRIWSRAILKLAKTLKYVELGEEQGDLDFFDDLDDDAKGLMESLSQMQALEHLRVPSSHICHVYDGGQISTPAPKLVDFLPPSIQTLYIERAQPSQLEDILALAQVATDKFPKLTQVTFDYLKQDLQSTVLDAYNACGVKCSFESVSVDDYGGCCDA